MVSNEIVNYLLRFLESGDGIYYMESINKRIDSESRVSRSLRWVLCNSILRQKKERDHGL